MVDIEESYVEHLTEEHRRTFTGGRHDEARDTIEVGRKDLKLFENKEESEKLRENMMKGQEMGFEFEDQVPKVVVETIHQKLAARISKQMPEYNKDSLLNAVLMAE